mmetsp:Transcript_12313/g.51795  ORF Transcript_12313/g.51795 Transcript_12313/m.51795 type:complete len:338 (-) Transcript_12313:552-1565(-)
MQRSHRVGRVGVGIRVIFAVPSPARGSETDDANLSNLEPSHGPGQQDHGLEREVPAPVLSHRLGVVDGQDHLVLPLGRPGSPEPDLVLPKVGSDVRDDLAHVQALTRAKVALQTRRERGLEDQPELFGEFTGERPGEKLQPAPELLSLGDVPRAGRGPLAVLREGRGRGGSRGFNLLRGELVLNLRRGYAVVAGVLQGGVFEHLERDDSLLAELRASTRHQLLVSVVPVPPAFVLVPVESAGVAAGSARLGLFIPRLGLLGLVRGRPLPPRPRRAPLLRRLALVRVLDVLVALPSHVAFAVARRVGVAVPTLPIPRPLRRLRLRSVVDCANRAEIRE